MRIKRVIIILAVAIPMLAMTNTASNGAVKICAGAKCNIEDDSDPINSVTCATYSDSCYNGYRVRSCKTCRTGTSLSSTTISVPGCGTPVGYDDCVFSGGTDPDECEGLCLIGGSYTSVSSGTNCATSIGSCYGTQKLTSCTTCPTGYTLTTKSKITASCGTVSYKTCVKDSSSCDGTCTNCVSSLRWSQLGDGVESRITKTCNTLTCNCLSSTEYRCASGYYGTANGLTNNCVECPSSGLSMAGSNTSITSCFVTSGKDGTGTYDYEPFCYYSD